MKRVESSMPTLSVVIPWRNRPELALTLMQNAPFFEPHDVDIIIVNAGGDRATLRTLTTMSGVRRVRGITLPCSEFNRSLCLNIGSIVDDSRYLFLLDGDIVLRSDFIAEALALLQAGLCFVAIDRITESAGRLPQHDALDHAFLSEFIDTRELVTVDGRRALLTGRTSPAIGLRGGHGLLLLRRQDMLAVGGLNSRLTGWGYEDTDFQIRLQLLLGLKRVDLGHVTHLSHSSSGRDQRAWLSNRALCYRNYNQGHYVGTLEHDAADWRERLVELDFRRHDAPTSDRCTC
jgi:hypothetical protein